MIKGTVEDNVAKFDNLEFEASNRWYCQLKKKKGKKEGMKKGRKPSLIIHSLFHYFHWK